MASLSIDYPQEILFALDQEAIEFEREARLLLAIKLFETNRLSSGLAARLAGLTRTAFLLLLGRYGVSAFGQSPDELDRDLENARRAGRPQ